MDLQNQMKKAVAEAAVNEVTNNMIVGLGSGSTAAIMIKTLANKIKTGELKENKRGPNFISIRSFSS